MEQGNNIDKILNLLTHNLTYNLIVLATQQLFSLANANPAKSFAKIVDFYKSKYINCLCNIYGQNIELSHK